jgi:hypothetical protein
MKHYGLIIWIVASVATAIILGLVLSPLLLRPPANPPAPAPPEGGDQLAQLVTIKTIVSFVNMALIVTLLALYYRIYSEIRSQFTLGLILFGYYPFGLGPFTVIPDLFTTFALLVLLYLSLE